MPGDELFGELPEARRATEVEPCGAPRLLEPKRDQVELRAVDIESLIGESHPARVIWAYPSLNARAEARGNALKDPAWQAFLGVGSPLLEEMHSTIMLPAPHSPLQ